MKATGKNSFPICSSVLYIAADLEDETGQLFIEKNVVTPKANRFVMFDSGINHCVGIFNSTDNRAGFNLNPWNYKVDTP